jgi:hypothetical protein
VEWIRIPLSGRRSRNPTGLGIDLDEEALARFPYREFPARELPLAE